MYILGINAYHGGSSACIIRDGQLIAAVEEERFTRQKYWAGFPVQSIQFCLKSAGISAYDLNHVGVSRDPKANLGKKVMHTLRNRPSFAFLRDRLSNASKVGDLKSEFIAHLGLEAAAVKADFHNVEHHRAHMASSFFVSPYQEAAVASIDAMGDFVSTMTGTGAGTELSVSDSINFPHSLGYFYTMVGQWLGFTRYGDEGKVMGLAPYGTPRYMDELAKVIRWDNEGSFELDLDYFASFADGNLLSWKDGTPTMPMLFSDKLTKLLGEPRAHSDPMTEYHEDVAASLQKTLEAVELSLLTNLQKTTGQKNLCLAGGVALNSAFNGKILPNTDFEEIYIQPAAGDSGTALGVCYYIYNQKLGNKRNYVMNTAYTGPCYENFEIEAALKRHNLVGEMLDVPQLAERAADHVANRNVLGWFQGSMEWGPRALGNRSIIADPRYAETKDILNARIKRREKFRPFAPAVLEEATGDYFDQTYPDPFMLKVYNVLPEKRDEIPAVTHVDGTGRLQTVNQEMNPRYHALIKSFGEKTGVPVILNTSFNENEPIVCTPDEAIACFLRTKMDVLAIGNYFVTKE
ncbi:MAG: carbamoyltransferase [Candidatus Promineifilaceae bacterium]